MTFAEKLEHLRRAAGMTQEELAQKLNLSRQAVYKWESGQSMPDIDNLKLLANTFSVTIDSLLNDSLTMPTLPTTETTITELLTTPHYGKVYRSSLNPGDVNADSDNLRRSHIEQQQLKIRRCSLWLTGIPALICGAIAVITLIVAFVQSETSVSENETLNTFVICAVFFGIGLILGILWVCFEKYLYRKALTSRSYFFITKEHSEKYLKEKHYWFQMLQNDLLAWFFFNPAEKSFGFYFKNKEQFVCPIQNYFSFTHLSSGHGIQQGTPQTRVGGIFGSVQGFSVDEIPSYINSEDTTFNFTLLYFNENGLEIEYNYILNSVRTYTIDMADSDIDTHIALQNIISNSTLSAFNKIKSKLDIEKQKQEKLLH